MKRNPPAIGIHMADAGDSLCYTPMHEVTPKVVAMAVSTVMMMLMILPQMFLFSIILFDVLRVDGFCCVAS